MVSSVSGPTDVGPGSSGIGERIPSTLMSVYRKNGGQTSRNWKLGVNIL